MAVRVAKRIEGQFHDRCGKEVKLSQPDRKNATTDCRWVRNYIDVMVFSSDPLILGGREKMFRVKAEPICPDTNETYPHIGVTTISPDSQLPKDYGEMKKSQFYWYLIGGIVFHNRKEKEMSNELMVSSGDCYGCSVDVQGRLVVYKNEEELGVAWEGLPTDQPLWAFTDVLDNRLTVDYHLAMEGTYYSCEYKRMTLYFLSNPPEWLFCIICQELAINPMQATCCGNVFCKGCIQKWQERSNFCPTCRCTPDSLTKFVLFEDVNVVRQINSLRVCCKNVEDGCRAFMDLSELKNHLISSAGCQFEKVTCKNAGCGRKMTRKIISDHEISQCSYRIVSCKYCKIRATFREIEDEHMKVCLEYPIVCSNSCGAPGLTRGTSMSHLRECPLEIVHCTNEECTLKLQRRALPNHLTDDCPYRSVNCQFCTSTTTHTKLQDHYMKACLHCPIACPNFCGESGITRGNLQAHIKTCPFLLVPCTNENCTVKLQRCKLEQHLTDSCDYRMSRCEYCDFKGAYLTVEGDHLKRCLGFPISCPNNCKEWGLTRGTLEAHLKICPFEVVECTNEMCTVKVHRYLLESHLAEVCTFRSVTCKYCKMNVPLYHVQVCLQRPVACPNNCSSGLNYTPITLNAHFKVCPYELIKCTNEKCQVTLKQCMLQKHLSDDCAYRLTLCQFCQMEVALCELNKEHQQMCPKYPIPCPNECEITGLTRDTLEAHCKECPLEEIDCDYRELGCEVRTIRSKMHSHLQDSMEYHQRLSAKEILHLRQENIELKEAIKSLNNKFSLLLSNLDLPN